MYLTEIKSIIYEKTGYLPRSCGTGFLGRCPAHDDHTPSLSLGMGKEGCVLLKCHVGCTIDQICKKVWIREEEFLETLLQYMGTIELPDSLIAQVVQYLKEAFKRE